MLVVLIPDKSLLWHHCTLIQRSQLCIYSLIPKPEMGMVFRDDEVKSVLFPAITELCKSLAARNHLVSAYEPYHTMMVPVNYAAQTPSHV